MRRHSCFALVIFLAISGLAISALAAEPIRIGSPLALSGRVAFAGVPQKKSLEMAVDDLNKAGGINGRSIELIFYDTEGKEDVAVRSVQRLIQKDKVIAILGVTGSWEAMALLPIIEKNEIPAIMLVASKNVVVPVRKWVFKVPPSDLHVVGKTLAHMQSKRIQRLALISSQDPYGDGGRDEILTHVGMYGIKVVFDERFTGEETDFTPLLNKIKKTDAQAVLNWSSKRAPEIITNNYRQLGLEPILYQNHVALAKSFLDATGKNAEGIFISAIKFYGAETLPDSDPQKSVILRYQNSYKNKYGEEAVQFGSNGFDGFNVMIGALRKGATEKQSLRNAIENTRNYVGVSGIYNFSPDDHNGITEESIAMYQVVGGVWKIIK